ncbi:MAG: hypothetical protein R3F30_06100 [Planctomycetota bacterium]
MKYYHGSKARLGAMPLGLRIVLALYLVTTILGFGLSGAKYWFRGDRDGALLRADGARAYYAERWDDQDALLAGDAAGPTRWLVDATHPHLFTVPIVLLVLGHLVQLSRGPQALKSGLAVLAFASFLACFGLPWLAPTWPGLAPAVPWAGATLVLSGIGMSAWVLVELVLGRPGRGSEA